jgi:hypothetical protein
MNLKSVIFFSIVLLLVSNTLAAMDAVVGEAKTSISAYARVSTTPAIGVTRFTSSSNPSCYYDLVATVGQKSIRFKNGKEISLKFDLTGQTSEVAFNNETYRLVYEDKISPNKKLLGIHSSNGQYLSISDVIQQTKGNNNATAYARGTKEYESKRKDLLETMHKNMCLAPVLAPAAFKKIQYIEQITDNSWLNELFIYNLAYDFVPPYYDDIMNFGARRCSQSQAACQQVCDDISDYAEVGCGFFTAAIVLLAGVPTGGAGVVVGAIAASSCQAVNLAVRHACRDQCTWQCTP